MSQLLCTAAALFTNVLPLTSNGLVESPELVTGGAVMPPSAEVVLTGRVAEPVPVAIVELEMVEFAAWATAGGDDVAPVWEGASTKIVLVVRVHADEDASTLLATTGVVTAGDSLVATAFELVTAAAAPVDVVVKVVGIVVSERIEPVTVA
jgi:hypothetical protein